MARRSPRVPGYKRHANGQAYVYHRSIPTKDHRLYLGRHGSEKSLRAYRAFLKRLEVAEAAADATRAGPAPEPLPAVPEPTITELAAAYLQHCEGYYRDAGGKATSEFSCMKEALGPLLELYPDDLASEFGAIAFDTYRQHLIGLDYARTTVNSHAGRVRRMFRWGAAKELVPASVWQALAAVEGLKAGRTAAREPAPIPAVDWETVLAALPFFSPVVEAMVTTQFWCGMRPQDVCNLRPCDIDRTGDVWLYRPARHKNTWRGHALIKAIPARVQPLLAARIGQDETAYLFSPREAVAWHAAAKAHDAAQAREADGRREYPSTARAKATRKAIRQARGPQHREKYSTDTYRQAVLYGLERQNEARAKQAPPLPPLPLWSPMQLRHGIATHLERTQGRQAAAKYLGHRHVGTTELYVERDAAELVEIARRLDALAKENRDVS